MMESNVAMSPPLITIGLTCFNAIETVERAVASAMAQTWRPIEIVAVDDCSTDGTRPLLDRLAARQPELRVLGNEKHGGGAVSRNRILAEARGVFIVFFDDDDESLPERLARQYARILDYEHRFAEGAPVICHTARRVIYLEGNERIEPTMGQAEDCPAPSGVAVARRILFGEPLRDGYGACPTCSQMARLSTYQEIGGFDPTLRRSEDTDFNICFALKGGHFAGIGRPLVIQRMTKTPDKALDDEYRHMLKLLEKHRAFMELGGQYDFCRRWIGAKYAWLGRQYAVFAWMFLSLVLVHPIRTIHRLRHAVRNFGLNRAFSRFHRRVPELEPRETP